MKITRLTTAVLEANFDWTFVKVETDEKITGYAEAFVGPALGVAQERHRQPAGAGVLSHVIPCNRRWRTLQRG